MYWTTLGRALAPCKIPEICENEIQICIDIPVKYLETYFHRFVCIFIWLHVHFFQFLPLSSSFFHFLPEETGRNTFFPVSSILPGRNLFLPEVSEPCFGHFEEFSKKQLMICSLYLLAGLTMHASILAYMFSLVENGKVTVQLGANQGEKTNELYIKEFTAGLLKAAFSHLQE